jgi:hypothetical protein
METTTNSIASCAANTPARGRFGIKNVTSGSRPNFKPNRQLAGIEPAQSAIEFEVVEGRSQTYAGRAQALKAADAAANPSSEEAKTKQIGHLMPVTVDVDGDERISQITIAEQNQPSTGNLPQVSFSGDELSARWLSIYYKSNSTLRIFYAGEMAEALENRPANDSNWKNAA